MNRAWVLAACAAAAGCASVLGIPNGSLSYCARPENQGHDYCEDFDVGDPSTRWSDLELNGGAAETIEPSDASPPNLVDFSAPALDGGSALAGFYKEFAAASFSGMLIEADVRFVTQGDAGIQGNGGFMLVGDTQGGCLGLGLGTIPAGLPADAGVPFPPGSSVMGAIVIPSTGGGCGSLVGLSGSGEAGSAHIQFVGVMPPPNKWHRLCLQVVTNGAGGGQMFVTVNPSPAGTMPVTLPPGMFPVNGHPLAGFASEVNGPSGPLDVQFDNITVDVQAQAGVASCGNP